MEKLDSVGANPEKVKQQIQTWFNRAAMAYEQGNTDLSKQALMRQWQYQELLAELEGTDPPEMPAEPDVYFRDWDGGKAKPQSGPGFGPRGYDPDQPSLVPRRPLPNTGAGEIAVSLPEQSSENEI